MGSHRSRRLVVAWALTAVGALVLAGCSAVERTSSDSVGTPLEHDRIVVGEWYWEDAPTFPFATTFVPAERCALVDSEGSPVG